MIDWFTVVAQLVNFLILIGLLRYFLFDRIVEAIDRREAALREQRNQARQQREQAEQELELARRKNRELDRQREQLLAEIRSEVDEFRKQQMLVARQEAAAISARWVQSIREQEQSFLDGLRLRAAEAICGIANRALADLADTSLESRMVDRFLQSLKTLSDPERMELAKTLKAGGHGVVIQSAHPLSAPLKLALAQELETILGTKVDVHYEQRNDLQCGIALQANSHKLAWNLKDYLAELEQQIRKMIDEATGSATGPPPETQQEIEETR